MLLSQLPVGSISLIKQLNIVDRDLYKRLLSLGIRPSAQLKILRKAPFGDSIQIEVARTRFIIRQNLAKLIQLEG